MSPARTAEHPARTSPAPSPEENGEAENTPQTLPEATPEAACGEKYPRTIKGKVSEGQCGKAPGHTGPHGRRPYTPRADVKEVAADVLASYEAVPSDEKVPVKADVAERSDSQKLVDAHVKDSHESWVAAGRPDGFNDSPRKRYMMNPDDTAGMVKMLRRAERLHGVRVRVAPVKTHESGKAMLYWVAVDQRKSPAPAADSNVSDESASGSGE